MQNNPSARTAAKTPVARFGDVRLATAELAFRNEMNQEMMDLLRSLPESVHTDAAVLLMEHFKTPFFPEFNYFQNYFAPSWSILYWLEQLRPDGGLPRHQVHRHALRAHAMALFLHPLDDHLNDGQLPASHLSLLLRSQAWLRMNAGLKPLAAAIPKGDGIVRDMTNDYYASIDAPPAVTNLDGYCTHFLKQMATWMTVPVLLAAGITAEESFCRALQFAYGAFGTAWRLMDDLQDMDADLAGGSPSAVYYMLPPPVRHLWNRPCERNSAVRIQQIREAIDQGGIVETLIDRIRRELDGAAKTMASIQLEGLAHELLCLAAPLVEGRTAP